MKGNNGVLACFVLACFEVHERFASLFSRTRQVRSPSALLVFFPDTK